MSLKIKAFQLPKDINLQKVENHFKIKLDRSIDWSFFSKIDDWKYIYFYKFSAIIFIGFDENEINYHLEKITERSLDKTILISQDYEIKFDSTLENSYFIKDNFISIKEYDISFIEIIAFSLAHTVAMEYYENITEKIFEKLNFYDDIRKFWQIKSKEKDLLKNIAELLSIKHWIVNELYLLDKPEIVWDDIVLEKLYLSLYNFFEIEDRFKWIEYKLNFMNENITFLYDVLDSKKWHFLEWVIIFLIVFEIIFTLIDFTEKYVLK